MDNAANIVAVNMIAKIFFMACLRGKCGNECATINRRACAAYQD